jgi:hypothetical protein
VAEYRGGQVTSTAVEYAHPVTTPICIVRHPGGTTEIPAGHDVTFGRVDAEGHHGDRHIGLSANPRLHARAGTVAADETGWTLRNTGRWLHLRVTPVGQADRTDVAPGRSLRVPWSEARVEVVTGDETVGLTVECLVLADDPRVTSSGSGDTVGGLGLDRSAGYFRAAVALCAPRLRDPSSTEVATVAQVARALGGAPGEPGRVTQKAVERRLAHLRTRLDIGGEDPTGVSAAGLEVRDAGRQLVDLLIRTGTVTPGDLALIEETTTDAGTSGS